MEEFSLGNNDNGENMANFLAGLDRSFIDDFGWQDPGEDFSAEEGEGE